MINSFLLFFTVFSPALIGFYLMHAFFRIQSVSCFLLLSSAGYLLGLAILSLFYQLILLSGFNYALLTEWVLYAVVAFLLFIFSVRRQNLSRLLPPKSKLSNVIHVAFLIALVVIISASVLSEGLLLIPGGSEHSQAFWNLNAKFIYFNPENWRDAFGHYFDNSRTSPLITFYLARSYSIAGAYSLTVNVLTHLSIFLAVLVLIFSSVSLFVGPVMASLASLMILSSNLLVSSALNQSPALLLSAYCLLIFVFVNFYLSSNQNTYIFLAFVTSSLLPLIFNEGIVIFTILFFGLIYYLLKRSARISYDFKCALLAVLPFIVYISYFKLFVELDHIPTSLSLNSLVQNLLNFENHKILVLQILITIFDFSNWNFSMLLVLSALVYIVYSKKIDGFLTQYQLMLLIFTCLYLGIILSNYKLNFYSNFYSSDVIIQLFPSLVFICTINFAKFFKVK